MCLFVGEVFVSKIAFVAAKVGDLSGSGRGLIMGFGPTGALGVTRTLNLCMVILTPGSLPVTYSLSPQVFPEFHRGSNPSLIFRDIRCWVLELENVVIEDRNGSL